MKLRSGNFLKHKYLFLSIAIILIALLLRYFFIREVQDKQRYIENISEKVENELILLDEGLDKVTRKVISAEQLNFTNLDVEVKHPYFIFKAGNLIYWSHNNFVPAYNAIAGDYQYKFLSLSNGQFIVHRAQLSKNEEEIEIYSFLPVFLVTKIDNTYLSAGFNPDIFASSSLVIKNFQSAEDATIHALDGTFLFSINFAPGFRFNDPLLQVVLLVLIILSLLFILRYIYSCVKYLIKKNAVLSGFLFLGLSLLLLRAVMLYFNFPFSIIEFDLFNSRYYASSIFNPSLGDLLLNDLLLFALIFYIFRYFKRISHYLRLSQSGPLTAAVLSVTLVLLSYAALYFQFYVLRTLYYHSQWSLDITSSIDFSLFKLLSFFIFLINAVMYFLLSHVIFKVLIAINITRHVVLYIYFVIGTLLFITIANVADFYFVIVSVVNGLYFSVLYFFSLPKYLLKIRYTTFLYLFVSALASAVTGAYAVYTFEQMKDINAKQQFANQLLIENDIQGEFLMSQASDRIKEDLFIKNRIFSPFYSKDIIIQKIRRVYLSNYLDKYEVEIYLYDAGGNPFDERSRQVDFATFLHVVNQQKYATEYDDLYFIDELSGAAQKRYINFNVIERQGTTIGYIILDFKLKKIIPNSVYPELLVDKRFLQFFQNSDYSYAIFSGDQILNNAGTFNYKKDFKINYFRKRDLYNEGIYADGYHHLGVVDQDGYMIVVSSPVYPISNVLANFSFLFIILFFSTLLSILIYTLYFKVGKVNLNYITKIQLYLNLAFFLPLLVVSITTLSLISSSHKRDIISRYFQRAESISGNIVGTLDNYRRGLTSKEALSNELAQVARFSESDLNLYDTEGKLIATNQPSIYENNLLSEYINPDALAEIKEQSNDKLLLNEQIGSLSYKSAYVGIKSFQTGDLIGILSIPFFESKYDFQKELIDAFTSIIMVFTFIFIVILIVSYFASRVLTYPLRYITQKIKRTSLAEYNEPLVWKSDDEIGLLVGEYNRMLLNLEASKEALSKTEKESAWREMAKQVAHEIKNPLTPMKLTLQHLQRLLKDGEENSNESVEKPVNTLLQQIETLSDIATSFSAFAQMPIPKNERFEIISVLKKTINLHSNSQEVNIEFITDQEEVYVKGDRQLMGRIFSNLIINGIQSVPNHRFPYITVNARTKDVHVIVIEIHDNGEGITEELREKVFIPNFSTKSAGSGLGLAIAKRGIEHAGGAIWFETRDGSGTSFYIELPIN